LVRCYAQFIEKEIEKVTTDDRLPPPYTFPTTGTRQTMTEMTKPLLKQLCKDNGLYGTASINDKIYLHYKGFKAIQNLDEYTGLRAMWLEGNGFTKIEGLEHQTQLRSLFLHENIIDKIEGLDAQVHLDALNLSKNYIKKIENLAHMKELTSLNLAHNHLTSAADVEHVLLVPSLQTLDLQHNKITDDGIVDVLAQMKDLRVLYLLGNPVVRSIKHYRKTIVGKCKALKYLDDRPVFDEERRRVDAWMAAYDESGGNVDVANEAERAELKVIRREKDEAEERNFRAFEELMLQGKEIRRQRELEAQQQALTTPAGTADLQVLPPVPTVNPFSGETVVEVPESDLVRDARERRWGEDSVPFSTKMQQKTSAEEHGAVREAAPPVPAAAAAAAAPVAPPPPPAASKPAGWVKLAIEEADVDENDDGDHGNDEVKEAVADDTTAAEAVSVMKVGKFSSLLQEAAADVAKEVKNTSDVLGRLSEVD